MTEILNTGWEADRIYKSTVTQTFQSPDQPVIITGYGFDLAMIPSDAPLYGGNSSAQILWYVWIDGIQGRAPKWGTPALKDTTGKQNLHGGGLGDNVFASAILKASPWTYAVNKFIHATGLRILVPAHSGLQMVAGHAGAGPIDFECQGEIFYVLPDK